MKMHQTSELSSAPLCTLLNHMELVPFLTLVCTALHNLSHSHGGCSRKGLSLGKQAFSQCQKWGRYLCELNPTLSAATALRHRSEPSAVRCCSSVPTPSQGKTLHWFFLLLFFLPHREKLARSASFSLNCFLFLMLKAYAVQLSFMLRC